jgi:hypothetical protein
MMKIRTDSNHGGISQAHLSSVADALIFEGLPLETQLAVLRYLRTFDLGDRNEFEALRTQAILCALQF